MTSDVALVAIMRERDQYRKALERIAGLKPRPTLDPHDCEGRPRADRGRGPDAKEDNVTADQTEGRPLMRQSVDLTHDRALDAIDWYRRCLEEIEDGRSVTGLREAKLGYDAAMEWLRTEPRRFKFHYAREEDNPLGGGSYICEARGLAEALEKRLKALGGKDACAKGAGFVCEGKWFPVRWNGRRWEVSE